MATLVSGNATLNASDTYMDKLDLEHRITSFHEELLKGYDLIVKMFVEKYQNSLPELSCHEELLAKRIDYWVKRGRDSYHRLERKLKEAEKYDEQLEVGIKAKLESVGGLVSHLEQLARLEIPLGRLHFLEMKPLKVVTTIFQVEDLCATLANSEQEMDERILQSARMEVDLRRTEAVLNLNKAYADMIQFPDTARLDPGRVHMVITITKPNEISEDLTALLKLKQLETKLTKTAATMWKHFVMPLIYSQSPAGFVEHIVDDASLRGCEAVTFVANAKYKCTEKPHLATVLDALLVFFRALNGILGSIYVDDVPFISLVAQKFSGELVERLLKDCVRPAVSDVTDEDALQDLAERVEYFEDEMNAFGVLLQATPAGSVTSEADPGAALGISGLLRDFERIRVDRKCLFFVQKAKQLTLEPMIETKKVGRELSEERHSTEAFEFEQCAVSESAFKLVQLVKEVLVEAAMVRTESAVERLTTTAQNVVSIYILLAVRCHKLELRTIPHIAAAFYNGCHYIIQQLAVGAVTHPTGIANEKVSLKQCTFIENITALRKTASDVLSDHLEHVKQQTDRCMSDSEVFVGLSKLSKSLKCESLVRSCLSHLEQTFDVWRTVMTKSVLKHSIGSVSSHFMDLLVNTVLDVDKITDSDAQVLARVLAQTLDRLTDITKVDDHAVLGHVATASHSRMAELIFCVNASLNEIGERWSSGKGKLASHVTSDELKKFINARFEATDARRAFLASIF